MPQAAVAEAEDGATASTAATSSRCRRPSRDRRAGGIKLTMLNLAAYVVDQRR